MVHCCVPECTNHSVKTESVSYHKIPNDQALQKAWLARIKRENLPNLKNCYVCSEHFESSCFEVDLMEQLTGLKRKRKLKKDAVPSVFSFSRPPAKRRATTENRLKRKQDEEVLERLCTTSSEPEAHAVEMTDTPVDMEMSEFPYEPPTKDIGVQCCFDCKYVATSTVSTQTDSPMLPTTTTTTEVADLSHPSGCSPRNDLNLHDHSYSLKYHCSPVKSLPTVSPQKSDKSLFSDDEGKTPDSDDDDDDFVSSQETSTTDNDSEPESSSSNPLDQYIKEPKYIVFDSCLKQLFRFCSECGAPVSDMKYAYQGSLLSVTTACMKHHASTWYSQPVINRAAVGNLLICSSILFTGNTFIRLQNFSSCLGLKFLSERVFYRHQKRYLFPVVNSAWKKEESRVLEELSEKAVVNLNGDGRCDSPGHCAKYGTYTMMESSSGKIATFNVVQVTEVSSSNAMEKEGFVRCLDKLEESVTISLITTDRHTSITSAMEKDYSHISHQYDVWHLSKSIVKKLNKKAKLKKYEELAPWIQSISNHLWWCASTCNGDAALLRAKWKSVLHHCTNKHSWRDSDIFKKCAHPRLTRREVLSTCWLKPGSPAHVALEEVVLQPKLVKDLARLTEFCHTGGLEVYHSVINKYCPKREHFSYEGMIARTQLAALDNNLNTGRKQAVIEKGPRSGEARWRKCFPKTHKRWVVKPVLEKKSYAFLPELQLKVLEVCAEGMEGAQIEPIDEVELPSNIASEPAPDKQELIQRHRTRFSRLTSDKGIITDGDKNYEQSSKCTWLIETSRSNSSIELVFDQFATECAWDHLYVYAGNSIHAPLLGTLSGLLRDTNIKAVAKDPIRHLTIKSNQAFLYFFSDANYILTGFNIKYRVKSDCSIKCNNHGQCGDQGNCICDEGWAGSSCNISTCPVSCVSGTCDTVTRQCQGCNSGYTGPSCNVTLGQGFWAHIPANNQENIIGRASHGAGLIDEWLWVYGGYSLNTAPFDGLIRYHLPSNAWEVVEPLSVPVPSRRYGHSLIVYNGSLIIYGGTINGKVTNQLWSFDTISRQWTLLLPDRGSDDPIAVSGHTATLVDNKMFVIFGYGPQEGYTQKVQEFDLVSRQWKFHSVNALIVLATFGHSSSYDPTTGRIYVFGGYRKITKQEISNELSFYLPSQNKWGVLLSSGYRRFLHSSVMMGDMLIVFGGNAHNDTANKSEKKAKCFTIDTFMYNTRCNVWSKISTEPLTSLNGRYGHTAVQANGTMYIFGGFQGTMLNDMLTYTPGDCSAYNNKTSCFQASSSYGCARDVKKDSCIGALDIPSRNPATIERPNCPASSNRCSTFDNCNRCLTSVFNCKWCRNVCKESSNHCDDKLVVSDLKKCPTIPPGSCSISGCASHTQCSNYSSCEGCVGNKDCIWCESQKQCVGLHAYILSFPYGQCHEWTKDKCTDVRCEDRMTCNDCHTLPGCGWCDDGSGTGLGKCTGGGDDGPFIPASNSSVITSDKCLPKDGKKRWFFIECPVCQCNGHSTCDEYDKCIACKDNTNGSHCQTCAKGYHGNPKNGGKCETCQCNEHGNVCNSESGVCDCQTKGVTGANCELCDDRKYYYGNSTNGGFCYYNLTSGYMFTFNVTGYTGVSFFNIPKRDDRNVQFSVKVIGDGAMMNMTYKYKSGPELALFNEKYLGNGVKYENSFKYDDFSFATSDRLTFFVYVYNVNGNCMIEISFSQISPFKLLQFFLTFFGCFFSILVVTFIAWKIRIRYNLHVMRRQRIVEMHKMAKRPSSTLKLSFEKHNDTYITKSFCNHVTIQPFAGSNAAVGTFVLRLPSLPNGFTPIGQSGMCFGSVLIDHRNHSSNAAHRCYTFQKPSDKRSRRTTQCI